MSGRSSQNSDAWWRDEVPEQPQPSAPENWWDEPPVSKHSEQTHGTVGVDQNPFSSGPRSVQPSELPQLPPLQLDELVALRGNPQNLSSPRLQPQPAPQKISPRLSPQPAPQKIERSQSRPPIPQQQPLPPLPPHQPSQQSQQEQQKQQQQKVPPPPQPVLPEHCFMDSSSLWKPAIESASHPVTRQTSKSAGANQLPKWKPVSPRATSPRPSPRSAETPSWQPGSPSKSPRLPVGGSDSPSWQPGSPSRSPRPSASGSDSPSWQPAQPHSPRLSETKTNSPRGSAQRTPRSPRTPDGQSDSQASTQQIPYLKMSPTSSPKILTRNSDPNRPPKPAPNVSPRQSAGKSPRKLITKDSLQSPSRSKEVIIIASTSGPDSVQSPSPRNPFEADALRESPIGGSEQASPQKPSCPRNPFEADALRESPRRGSEQSLTRQPSCPRNPFEADSLRVSPRRGSEQDSLRRPASPRNPFEADSLRESLRRDSEQDSLRKQASPRNPFETESLLQESPIKETEQDSLRKQASPRNPFEADIPQKRPSQESNSLSNPFKSSNTQQQVPMSSLEATSIPEVSKNPFKSNSFQQTQKAPSYEPIDSFKRTSPRNPFGERIADAQQRSSPRNPFETNLPTRSPNVDYLQPPKLPPREPEKELSSSRRGSEETQPSSNSRGDSQELDQSDSTSHRRPSQDLSSFSSLKFSQEGGNSTSPRQQGSLERREPQETLGRESQEALRRESQESLRRGSQEAPRRESQESLRRGSQESLRRDSQASPRRDSQDFKATSPRRDSQEARSTASHISPRSSHGASDSSSSRRRASKGKIVGIIGGLKKHLKLSRAPSQTYTTVHTHVSTPPLDTRPPSPEALAKVTEAKKNHAYHDIDYFSFAYPENPGGYSLVQPTTNPSIINKHTVDSLALGLTQSPHVTNDFEEVRAIFSWICSHISYDTDLASKGSEEKVKRSKPSAVLESRKAISSGYAALFDALAKAAKIESYIISGLTFRNVQGRLSQTDSSHAWNAVKIQGNFFLLDCTLGAGSCTGSEFSFSFTDFFFLPRPDQLIYSHFPMLEGEPLLRWQLLSRPFDKEAWERLPHLAHGWWSGDFQMENYSEQKIIEIPLGWGPSAFIHFFVRHAAHTALSARFSLMNVSVEGKVFVTILDENCLVQSTLEPGLTKISVLPHTVGIFSVQIVSSPTADFVSALHEGTTKRIVSSEVIEYQLNITEPTTPNRSTGLMVEKFPKVFPAAQLANIFVVEPLGGAIPAFSPVAFTIGQQKEPWAHPNASLFILENSGKKTDLVQRADGYYGCTCATGPAGKPMVLCLREGDSFISLISWDVV
eukprot:TRINITY_DN1344_c0_g1_i1.p1 TRINITY_DN1344_c0_g1~~TRINITY_DN1344_c0_g1_i1.p1  ORF type:complete len:1329 (+),score=267.67 TRINITY_DN1344_c0_g1_i1:213-4199(+)